MGIDQWGPRGFVEERLREGRHQPKGECFLAVAPRFAAEPSPRYRTPGPGTYEAANIQRPATAMSHAFASAIPRFPETPRSASATLSGPRFMSPRRFEVQGVQAG